MSDRVLIAAIKEKPTPLPPGILKDIIKPNSRVSDTVYSTLSQISSTLPPGIMADIQSVQIGESVRSVIEKEVANYQTLRDNAVNELMQHWLSDTTAVKTDSIIAFLKTQTDIGSKQQLVQYYLANGQCNDALLLLNQLPKNNLNDSMFYDYYTLT